MIRFFAALLLAGLIASVQPAEAAIPKNALGAVAVSPDGRTVLAAGDNRVLYVLDAAGLTVQKRVWLGINPLEIHYSADGGTFVLHDSKGALRFYDSASLKLKTEVSGVEKVALAEQADVIFSIGRVRGRGEEARTPLRAYSMSTGRPVLDKTVNSALTGLGVDADARRIFAISKSIKSNEEMVQKPPSNLAGAARETFRMQNDGKVSQLLAFDVEGKELGRHTSWYSTTRQADLVPFGNILRVITFSSFNVQFTLGSMESKLYQDKNSFNYGIGYSIKNKLLVTGGLANGTVTQLDTGEQRGFRINRIGGWPEYFKGFAVAADGTIYGTTTAYRLVRISPDGAVKAVPVY